MSVYKLEAIGAFTSFYEYIFLTALNKLFKGSPPKDGEFVFTTISFSNIFVVVVDTLCTYSQGKLKCTPYFRVRAIGVFQRSISK